MKAHCRTELLRQVLMTLLHLLVRDVELGIAGTVGSDLGGFGTAETLLLQMLLDWLAPRAAGLKVLLRVALYFGCPVRTLFNLVAKLF